MKRVKFYNPREMSEDILEEMFVGREAILNEILEDLRRQSHSKTRQHWIITGSRGIGKTHLVGMIYHRVRRDEELSNAYFPIWTGEADAYEIYSAGVLLSKIAQRYLEEIQKTDEAAAMEFSRLLDEANASADDESLFEDLCDLLKNEAKRRQKILLIMIENLDVVLFGFSPRESTKEAKRLRSLLTHDREFLFINTTPASHISRLSDPKEPLFGQLKSRALDSLSEEDMCRIFEKLGTLTGQAEKGKSFCDGEKSSVTRKVLHRLVGGNVRSVVMAFEILSSSSKLDTLIEEFNSLLDVHTAYYEARLAYLAPRERAIVAAMSLSRENLTLQEIAKATRLPERSLSTQVDRLIEDGHLIKAGGAGGRGTIYSITDGLFRLWYQYRYGKKILEPLVRFIALWFDLSDIENMQKEFESRIVQEARAPLEKMEFEVTLKHLEAACRYAMDEDGKKEREMIWVECEKEIRKKELTALIAAVPKNIIQLRKLTESGPEATEKKFREVIEKLETSEVEEARLWLIKTKNLFAIMLVEVGRGEEAILFHKEIIEHYSKIEKAEIQEQVAIAMLNLSVIFGKLNHNEEEIQGYSELIERFGKSDQAEIQELISRAMFYQSLAFGKIGHNEERIQGYIDLIERFGKSERAEIQEQVANAMLDWSITLEKLDLFEDAISIAKNLIKRYIKYDNAKIHMTVGIAMTMLGSALVSLDKYDEGISVFRDFIERYGTSDNSDIQRLVANAVILIETTKKMLDQVDELGEEVSDVVNSISSQAEKYRDFPIEQIFLRLLPHYPLLTIESWIDTLENAGGEIGEKASLYRFVLNVVKAGEPSSGKESKKGPAERIRKALARVPPELRQTVEEMAESIRKKRRHIK